MADWPAVLTRNEPAEPARGARGLPAFTCPIHPNATASVEIGHVPYLPRSALACWWSISHLVRTASPCHLWTFTSAEVVPDNYFGNMHRTLVANVGNWAKREKKSSDGGTIPKNWGGVRVFELHPKGHGIHAHWVVRGYMPWELMQKAAMQAGLGKIVHVDPEPVSIKAAYYLAKYLTKEDKLRGVRQWSNIGTYEGIGKRDVSVESARLDRIKALSLFYRSQGKHRYTAYRLALQEVDDSETGSTPF